MQSASVPAMISTTATDREALTAFSSSCIPRFGLQNTFHNRRKDADTEVVVTNAFGLLILLCSKKYIYI